MEFCTNSTVHGVRYLAERNRHWTERFFWLLAICTSIWLCGSSIQDMWHRWNQNPVQISFTEKDLPISSIPFPSVTLCPETKAKHDKLDVDSALYDLRKSMTNFSDEKYERNHFFFKFITFSFHRFFQDGHECELWLICARLILSITSA